MRETDEYILYVPIILIARIDDGISAIELEAISDFMYTMKCCYDRLLETRSKQIVLRDSESNQLWRCTSVP